MKAQYLAMKNGVEMIPIIGFNVFFIILLITSLIKNGSYYIFSTINLSVTLFTIFNIPTVIIMYPKIWHKISFDGSAVYVRRAFEKSFPLRAGRAKMALDDIETVDLRSDVNPVSKYKSETNLSVIVLYGRGWDGHDIFALDPRWANKYQFRDLISTIYDRHPEAFTENAKRYVEDGYTDPPCIDEYGELIW